MTDIPAPAGLPEIVRRAFPRESTLALSDGDSYAYYGDLVTRAGAGAEVLLGAEEVRAGGVGGAIGLLGPPEVSWVIAQWSIWRAGRKVVPLGIMHPEAELAHVLDDSGARAIVVHPGFADQIAGLARARGIRVFSTSELAPASRDSRGLPEFPAEFPAEPLPELLGQPPASPGLPAVSPETPALMLYTSGTTGRPKGVVHTHSSLAAQMDSLSAAWEWSARDHILLSLPLHHVHGLVNVLGCALWNGARCSILPRFETSAVWERLALGDLTLFMGVPTQYSLLLEAFDAASASTRRRWSEGAKRARLMVSGSAALPIRTLERWEAATGHRLLERYGMTEIGMALSNPLHGQRRPGHVGVPLPSVEVRLVGEDGAPVLEGDAGEIQVRGPTLFQEYWGRPDETSDAADGPWFRTGDLAMWDSDSYRILGRLSVDILKTAGYKVSALEIEDVLREHPLISGVAVVGVPDEKWGDRVGAAITLRRAGTGSGGLPIEELRGWATDRLAPYKMPTLLRIVRSLPRNAMGKVEKKRVQTLFEEDAVGGDGV